MLRITKIREDAGSAELLVEGRLTAATAADLIAACEPLLDARGRLLLDLSGLRFADDRGLGVLRALFERGAVPVRCTDFVTQLLAAK